MFRVHQTGKLIDEMPLDLGQNPLVVLENFRTIASSTRRNDDRVTRYRPAPGPSATSATSLFSPPLIPLIPMVMIPGGRVCRLGSLVLQCPAPPHSAPLFLCRSCFPFVYHAVLFSPARACVRFVPGARCHPSPAPLTPPQPLAPSPRALFFCPALSPFAARGAKGQGWPQRGVARRSVSDLSPPPPSPPLLASLAAMGPYGVLAP